MYPSYYEWSRRVADHQRDNVLSPNKAKAKKPRCSEQLSYALVFDPHIREAATPLPVAMPMPAAMAKVVETMVDPSLQGEVAAAAAAEAVRCSEAPPPRTSVEAETVEGFETTAMIDADSSSVSEYGVNSEGWPPTPRDGDQPPPTKPPSKVGKAALLRTKGAAAVASGAKRTGSGFAKQAHSESSTVLCDLRDSAGDDDSPDDPDGDEPIRARERQHFMHASYTTSLLRPAAGEGLVGSLLECLLDDHPLDDDVVPGPRPRRLECVQRHFREVQDEGDKAMWRNACQSLAEDSELALLYGTF